MHPIEQEGRTVAEAIDAALHANGLRRDQVEVTVLEEGNAGFMGIGSKPARVRLSEKRWGDAAAAEAPATAKESAKSRPSVTPRSSRSPVATQKSRAVSAVNSASRSPRREKGPGAIRPITPAETAAACSKAQTLVMDLLKLMGIASPSLTVVWDAGIERVKISVESQDAPVLVGHDGRVLESLQFLTALMLNRGAELPLAIQVDALSYWEKREQSILDEARKGIAAAMADHKPYRLEPMDPAMRRLIHRTFAANPDITTSSEGEGSWRKIVIRPRTG